MVTPLISESPKSFTYECARNILATGLATVYLGAYLTCAVITGELNPIKQRGVEKSIEEKVIQEQRRQRFLNKNLFGKNGLADLDGDGNVSASEKFQAYNKMGVYDNLDLVISSRIPSTVLEKGFKIYKGRKESLRRYNTQMGLD